MKNANGENAKCASAKRKYTEHADRKRENIEFNSVNIRKAPLDLSGVNANAPEYLTGLNSKADEYVIEDTKRDNTEIIKSIVSMKDTHFKPEDKISTKEFVKLLMSCKGDMEPEQDEAVYMEYALKRGIIEDYDLLNKNKPIERRRAARIIHEYLLTELAEKDEADWSAAEDLIDLYSCRSCVMHIAQVYVKGIMPANKDRLFEPEGKMTWAQAIQAVEKMLDKEKRAMPKAGKNKSISMLSPEEAWRMLADNRRAMLIDVRSYEEYNQGHIAGSRCIPLDDIIINPHIINTNGRRDTPVILYCYRGYKSSIAAKALIDAGYKAVYTIPGIEQYEYKLNS